MISLSHVSPKRALIVSIILKLLLFVPTIFYLLLCRIRVGPIRIAFVVVQALGHMLSDFEIALNRCSMRNKLLVVPIGKPANLEIFRVYRQNSIVVPRFFRPSMVTIVNRIPTFKKWLLQESIGGYDHELRAKAPILKGLSQFSNAGVQTDMAFLGLDFKQPLVTLCVRDDSRISELNYRNSDINDFLPLIEYLTVHNYQVIRMGRRSETWLRKDIPGYFDYSSCKFQTDKLDLAIIEISSFVISTGTGLDDIAFSFRKPVLYMNTLPILIPNTSHLLKGVLPKLLWKTNKLLSFSDLCKFDLLNLNRTSQFENFGITYTSNGAVEMVTFVEDYLSVRSNGFCLDMGTYSPISRRWKSFNYRS